ncbi:hypothetical protein A4A49_17841 [Nicotiana attenuata]|uniref:Uncharacterized protein n=1 Tax=Nicotiana attenuata TaxID=49451 RepID=A0A314L5J0_NICAT|nr:hypothetical protein A4A49_17841 [Nicotiana attenuata]
MSSRVIMVIVALVGTLVCGINGERSYSKKLFEGGGIGFSDFTENPTPDVKQFGGIGGFPEIDSPQTDQSNQHPFGANFIPTPDQQPLCGSQHPLSTGDPITNGWNMIPVDSSSFTPVSG